eukprot:3411317-Pyramimonas_sp.AAC.1
MAARTGDRGWAGVRGRLASVGQRSDRDFNVNPAVATRAPQGPEGRSASVGGTVLTEISMRIQPWRRGHPRAPGRSVGAVGGN